MNLNDNGRYHFSVVGPMMFPLVTLDQVVPPSLHIMLGVVLLLYNLLLKECRDIDKEEGNLQIQENEKKVINQEWEIASDELHKVEKELSELGGSIVECINRKARCEAVSNKGCKEK